MLSINRHSSPRARLVFLTVALVGLVIAASPAPAQSNGETMAAASAAADLESALLGILSPAQLDDFMAGADPAAILLADGSTLEDFLLEGLIDTASDSVYHPLNQCVVAKTVTSVDGKFDVNEFRNYLVRGETTDLSDQGGNAGGCGVAADATAVVLNVKAYAAAGNGQVFVYPTGHTAVPSVLNVQASQTINNMATVAMGSIGDFTAKSTQPVHLVIHTVGYFSPAAATGGDTLALLDCAPGEIAKFLANGAGPMWHCADDDTNDPMIPDVKQDLCELYDAADQPPGPDFCCGDGVVETNLGEDCEPPGTASCDASCQNVPCTDPPGFMCFRDSDCCTGSCFNFSCETL